MAASLIAFSLSPALIKPIGDIRIAAPFVACLALFFIPPERGTSSPANLLIASLVVGPAKRSKKTACFDHSTSAF